MDVVLVTQYFDTMKETGASSKSSAVFISKRCDGHGSCYSVF